MNKTILIICETGISASLLVSKMLTSVRKQKLAYDIDYAPVGRIQEKLSYGRNYDVILLTPQVTRYESEINQLILEEEPNSQFIFIQPDEFRYMDADKIIQRIQ
ncbi:PTS cellobiose transporter subunit IIC [Carnobacterium gallinarum]|uniref:PTS sugar transporter subunit IIB n=1 Tax=Carnobacterium gallinarum TaxID=2749 RepID=UPI00054FEDDB|nr:PTS cellobiose transporter subunit IIC [Carnobacterium gallinarum]